MTEKIIFDCDNTLGLAFKEVDDGLTLLYLLGIPEIDLLGITTTFGNGTIDQVFKQTQKLTKQISLDIHVLKGEAGRGHTPDTPAAHFLAEMVDKYPHQISLLATGPVGNLHSASKLNPEFYKKIKRIAVMGGYIMPEDQLKPKKTMKLGYRQLAELNFSSNPEAAYSVLNAPCPVTVFPGQACLDAPFIMANINQAVWWPPELRKILRNWLFTFGIYCGVREFYLWDLLPAVFLTAPEHFKLEPIALSSTLADLQDGLLVGERTSSDKVITVATGINDRPAFFQQINDAWQRSAEKYPFMPSNF